MEHKTPINGEGGESQTPEQLEQIEADRIAKEKATKDSWWDEDELDAIDDPVELRKRAKEMRDAKKKLESDTQKGAEKIINEKKKLESDYQAYRTASIRVGKEPEYLVHLYDENQSLAKEILKDFYDGISLKQFVDEELDGVMPEKSFDPEKEREKIRKELEEEQSSKQTERLLNKYLKDIDTKYHEDVKEEFKDLIGNRKLTIQQVKKYFKIAVNEVNPPKKETADVDVIKSQVTQKGGWSSSSKNKNSWVSKFIADKNKAEGRTIPKAE